MVCIGRIELEVMKVWKAAESGGVVVWQWGLGDKKPNGVGCALLGCGVF